MRHSGELIARRLLLGVDRLSGQTRIVLLLYDNILISQEGLSTRASFHHYS